MNTTFTNYAEKKAKQFLNLLQGYTKGIRITAILILLLMGVNSAWAVNHTGGYVYFLKPSTWTESTVMMFIGKNDYTSVYTMTKVDNTDNLYRYTMPSWDGATYVAFANAGGAWGSGSWGPNNRTNAPHYTNVYNNYGFNSGSYYIVVPASTSNNAGITINYTGTSASTINLTTKAIASDKAHGTVSVSGYYMSAYNTASTRSAVSSSASNATASTTLAPGSTATFNATASTGYEFEGWYDAATGGNQLSTNSTYTFKYDISYTGKTVYARFKAKQYTITYKDQGNVTFTGTHASGYPTKHTYGTATTLSTATKTGYTFGGWHTDAACTNKVTSLGATEHTANITLYAQWTAIPANIHDITYTAQGTGWTYGASNPISAEEEETVTFVVTPTTGYSVSVTSNDVTISGPNANNEYTFTMPAKDVAINVSATEILSTITIVANPERGGTLTVDDAAFTSGNTVQVGVSTAKKVTANPNPGYGVNAWAVSSRDIVKASGGTTVTLNADGSGREGTLYANFGIITYDITYNLDGGTNHANNPASYTVETPTITLQDPTRNGYTFGGWYNNSSFSGSPITTISQGSTDNITLYAKWTEITSTVTVTTANEAYGTLKFGSTTKDWGTTASVGVTTTQNITATANNGYKFVRWELTGGAQSSSTLTDATITLKGDGNGTEGTATAVFEEDLSTSYVLKGGSAFGGTAWSTEYKLEKKSGQSTIDIAYVTFTLNSTNIGNSNDDFNFKIVKKGTDDTWYGLTADGSYWYNRSTGEQTLSTSGADIQLRADVTGTYEIKVDYTKVDDDPKITVIFPSSSMSLVGTFNDWNESANPFVIDGDIATATIDLPMGEYEFKINDGGTWRTMTADSRVVTRDANQDINFNTTDGSGNNTILNADATGTYTFKYNKSSQTLTVEYPDIAIRLTGEFNGWNNSDDNYKFTEDPAKPGTYTLTKHFDKRERWQAYGKEQAEYEFKLNINGKSYTVEGDGEAKVLQYTRQNTTKIVNDGTDYTEQPHYNLLRPLILDHMFLSSRDLHRC